MAKNTFTKILDDNISNKEYLNDVISVFNEINNGVVRLYRFAGEDFKLMRDQFKKFNRQSILISENVDDAFKLLAVKKSFKIIIKRLEEYGEQQESYFSYVKTKIESNREFINELYRQTELMCIPVKNLYQHISSLKIVLNSLKLYPFCTSSSNSSQKGANHLFDLIKEIYTYFDSGIESTMNSLSNAKKHIRTEEKLYSDSLHDFRDKINTCKELFQKKYQEALVRNHELASNIQENVGNSNKIITELQYHDIIRQKIEHIIQVHNQIIDQLTNYKTTNDSATHEDIVKYLAQFSDLARIQAAQLLYANKEYESAIDTISEKLLSFSGNMIAIVDTCNGFSTNMDDSYVFHIVDDIVNSNYHFRNKLYDSNIQIDEQFQILNNKIVYNKKNFSRITELINKIATSAEVVLGEEDYKQESKKILKVQAYELIKNIRLTVSFFKEIFQKISEIENNAKLDISKKYSRKKHKQILNSIADYEQKIMPEINEEKQALSSVCIVNGDFTENLTDRILKVIRSVKYYEYFDIIAESIINKLNSISKTFYISGADPDTEDIEYMKAGYTMHSERETHNGSINHGESDVEFFVDLDESDDEEKVELFH